MARVQELVDANLFLWLEKAAADCSVYFAFHPIEGDVGTMVERYTFSSLRDFLYVKLGKAITHGSELRQCRLCGRWFLHEQGDRATNCGQIAPSEERKTCREAGA